MTVYDPNVPIGGAGYLSPATDHEDCCGSIGYVSGIPVFCIRGEDHDGDHAAHVSSDAMGATWPQISH